MYQADIERCSPVNVKESPSTRVRAVAKIARVNYTVISTRDQRVLTQSTAECTGRIPCTARLPCAGIICTDFLRRN